MPVKLISYSQSPPTENGPGKSIQDSIAFCARVSNPANQHNTETNEHLFVIILSNCLILYLFSGYFLYSSRIVKYYPTGNLYVLE